MCSVATPRRASSSQSRHHTSISFELSSPSAVVPGVVADLAIAHPVGTVLSFQWAGSAASTSDDGAPGTPVEAPLPGAPVASACTVDRGRTVTRVRCALGAVGTVRALSITVQADALPAAGALVPELRLTAERAAVETATVRGAAITVGP